jgi:DnaJ-class molecular chaperone
MPKNYYSVLGVSRIAEPAAIHSAFRHLARRYHPDTGKISSPAKFREAVEAYETLRDPVRRRQHDVDLGFGASKRLIAEPLFAPTHFGNSRSPYATHSRSPFDDIFDEITRFLGAEFGSSLDFF